MFFIRSRFKFYQALLQQNQYAPYFFYIVLGLQTISAYFTLPQLLAALPYVSYLHFHVDIITDLLMVSFSGIGFAIFAFLLSFVGLRSTPLGRLLLFLLSFDVLLLTAPLAMAVFGGRTFPKVTDAIIYIYYVAGFATVVVYAWLLKIICQQIGIDIFMRRVTLLFMFMMLISALSIWVGRLDWAENLGIIAFWLLFVSAWLYALDLLLNGISHNADNNPTE